MSLFFCCLLLCLAFTLLLSLTFFFFLVFLFCYSVWNLIHLTDRKCSSWNANLSMHVSVTPSWKCKHCTAVFNQHVQNMQRHSELLICMHRSVPCGGAKFPSGLFRPISTKWCLYLHLMEMSFPFDVYKVYRWQGFSKWGPGAC